MRGRAPYLWCGGVARDDGKCAATTTHLEARSVEVDVRNPGIMIAWLVLGGGLSHHGPWPLYSIVCSLSNMMKFKFLVVQIAIDPQLRAVRSPSDAQSITATNEMFGDV